jgi:acylphosphatase
MLHYHIIVRGGVQGVGFRYFTRESALACGVNGWVKNRADGSVEVEAEGDEENIAAFIGALKRGSGYSSVESVDIQKIDGISGYRTFEITGDDW